LANFFGNNKLYDNYLTKTKELGLPGGVNFSFILALNLNIGAFTFFQQPWSVPDLHGTLLAVRSVGQFHLEFVQRTSHQLASCRCHIHHSGINKILKLYIKKILVIFVKYKRFLKFGITMIMYTMYFAFYVTVLTKT